ncbi:synaptic vesicle glycoprotein 2B-like [Sitophilus oryzae]|uniref:Synaptic vesicle glycoprotein 2B-like n=1 Tax=Sitophilus oryzae TaxID=7048 RepID=A0A6J2Y2E5_SITOR|nr:synaptic vesicle glycoprotein 2B-like [Sitophilus oryzae]
MFNSASGVFVDIEIERDPETDDAGHGDFETAINFARFGKFQKILLAISGLIYATCAISSTTLSFVLPSAQCDFRLTSVDKGKLSAMPLVGMLFGCCLWGSLADSHGRKVAIILSLLLDFLSGLISSFVTDFNLFLACRFFNGFGIIGATSIIFSYLGEFISIKDRDRILGKLEIFWNIGIIILPGVAWSLLGKKTIEIIEDGGSFSPWRTFVLICSLPSLFSAVLLYFLPETPKYLISKKMYEKARLVFQKIYTFNTGDDGDNFPVHHLQEEDNNNKMEQKHKNEKKNFWKDSLSKLHDLIETLRSHQYLRYLGITCFADFGLMASYYTLVLWFPEIFERFDSIGMKHSNNTRGVCAISQTHIQPSKHHDSECDPFIENKVFSTLLYIP